MYINRKTIVLISLLFVFFSLGCTTINNGIPLRETPITPEECPTKLDVHKMFGAPDNIFHVNGMRYMTYSSSKIRGCAIAVEPGGFPILSLSRKNTASNNYIFEIDQDDNVRQVFNYIDSHRVKYQLWPFGD